jgi:hypothetical protein
MILQAAGTQLVVFLFSVIFSWASSLTRLGWLLLLFIIWLGYVLGINLVGWAALRWVWKDNPPETRLRLIGSAIGVLIPLLILLLIGYSVPVGDMGTRFYDLVTNLWQPILAQTAVLTGLVGYYVPGVVRRSG